MTIPLLATTPLLRRYAYVCPALLMHHSKSHPSHDSYPFPGAPLKILGHACHVKPVFKHTSRTNSNWGRAFNDIHFIRTALQEKYFGKNQHQVENRCCNWLINSSNIHGSVKVRTAITVSHLPCHTLAFCVSTTQPDSPVFSITCQIREQIYHSQGKRDTILWQIHW